MPRVFAALTLPHEVCDTLDRDIRALSRFDRLARLTPSTDFHITLAFIGDIALEQAQRLSAALRPLAMATPREISLGRLGLFDRSGVLWAGLTPAESLDPVAKLVREKIQEMGLPYDKKPFRPHITIARNWRRPYPMMTLPARTFRLGGPVLFESEMDPRTRQVRYRQIL